MPRNTREDDGARRFGRGTRGSWGARPPSVDRLPGLVWLAYVSRGRSFDQEFAADIRGVFRDFHHLDLTDSQLRTLTTP